MTAVSGIVLAAGRSSRSETGNKLLQLLPDGVPVIRRIASLYCQAGLAEVIVVTGHQAVEVAGALKGLPLRLVHAADHAAGMGSSLAAGVRAASHQAVGFLVTPGDLPWLDAATLGRVISAFQGGAALGHVVPVHEGTRGHPVALSARVRSGLEQLSGDEGARRLLATPEETARTLWLDVSDPGIHQDIDTGLSRGGFRNP